MHYIDKMCISDAIKSSPLLPQIITRKVSTTKENEVENTELGIDVKKEAGESINPCR